MLIVTKEAGAYLARMLSKTASPENPVIRIIFDRAKFKMKRDEQRPGDATFSYKGNAVLVMDQNTSLLRETRTLDALRIDQDVKLAFD